MEFDLNAIFKMSEINEKTQSHLSKVYGILGGGICLSAVTAYISSYGLIPYQLILLVSFISLISEIAYLFTRHSKFAKEVISPYSFYSAVTCVGASIGLIFVDGIMNKQETEQVKGLFLSSFIMTASIFISMSVFSLLTVRRTSIFLGTIIASLVLSIIGFFLLRTTFGALIGLLIGISYVIIDTQLMIMKAEKGIFEEYEDARHLFYDLVKIFMEIIKILSKKEKENK